MGQRFSSFFKRTVDDDMAAGRPFYLLLFLVMAGVYVYILISDASLRQPGRLALFTGLMLVHAVLHFYSFRVAEQRRWLLAYFLIQGALVLAIGYLTQLQGFVPGLYMALVGEAAGILWPDRRAVALATCFYTLLMGSNIVVIWGFSALVQLAPLFGGMLAFVLIYVVLYIRQVQARGEAQAYLQELEVAHRQLTKYAERVEELTISQERQRMARELHDTLAQGLAGLILQLEAADSYLESGNLVQGQTVVQQAMQRARTTLQEARRAIQALRPAALEQDSLIDAVGREVDQLAATTGLQTAIEVSARPSVPPETAQDILRIVQESLSNVARHAQASHVQVRLARQGDGLEVIVRDDGKGFGAVEGQDRSGCFGLAGMKERAERMGGELRIESRSGKGTTVILSVPGGVA
jgi:NarL family two-component system sensor histidine kinase YdfH